MRGVSLTHPVLALFFLGSFSYTFHVCSPHPPHPRPHPPTPFFFFFFFFFMWGVSLRLPMLALFFIWGVSLTHPVLDSFLPGEFLLHIPSRFHFYLGSFSYTSRAGFVFIWGVSHTHPVLSSVLCKEFLLHIPCWLLFSFTWGVSLTRPMLVLLFSGWVSLTHLVLASFLSGEFLLHIPCWLHFYLGSVSYISRAGFFFIWGVSLTHPLLFLHIYIYLKHPVLVSSFFLAEFFLHISCWLHFCLGSFSYTSRAGFIFLWGVSLSHPVLASFLSREFLLHIPWQVSFFLSFYFIFYLGSFSYTSRAGFFFFLFMWGDSLECSLLWRQPLKKRAAWEMALNYVVEKVTFKTEKDNTLYRTEQNRTRTEWQMATEKKGK